MQTHQNNHLRIQELRQASSALDTQIRDTLTSLATTRRDIVNTPTTTFAAAPNYPIHYEELLSYARRISKTSMPPAATIAAAAAQQQQLEQQQQQEATASGAQTPVTPAPVTPAAATPIKGELVVQQPAAPGITTLPEALTQYLNPLSGQVFFPWPLEDKIRSGALAANQMLTEQGIDPRGFDPVAEEERKKNEEEERKEREEKETKEREEKERQLLEERERLRVEREKQREKEAAEWRRSSTAEGAGAAGPKPAEKKQFQFTNLDDLDDDDDDDD